MEFHTRTSLFSCDCGITVSSQFICIVFVVAQISRTISSILQRCDNIVTSIVVNCKDEKNSEMCSEQKKIK